MTRTRVAVLAAAAAVVLLAAPGRAGSIQVFEASGFSSGEPHNGKAEFDVTSTSMTITLWNTAGPGELDAIGCVLDGLIFGLDAMPASLLLTGATSTNGSLLITDLGGGAASWTPTAGPISDNDSWPFDWGLLGSGPFLLAAGNGSYKPYGIVNGNIEPAKDGLRNGPHNPYLMGPVTFTFAMTGLAGAPVVEDVVFLFGTEPDHVISEVPSDGAPEPGSIALLGLGLLGTGVIARRRRAR